MVATPWDANMDAEQKLKGRVSVDQRMMTAHCQQQQQHTGDGLAASLQFISVRMKLKQPPQGKDRHVCLFDEPINKQTRPDGFPKK